MRDDRQVKFNVTIAKYEYGQVVNYADMPPGHQHWVNNKSILESTRICEFVEDETLPEAEKESVKEDDVPTDLAVSEKEPEVVTTPPIDISVNSEMVDGTAEVLEASAEPTTQATLDDELKGLAKDTDDTKSSAEPTTNNGLSFNFDKGDPETPGDVVDDTQTPPITCLGKKADGNPCERSRLKSNGYCFQHQDQAPVKLPG